jgi:AcrR family transcriptional regulator
MTVTRQYTPRIRAETTARTRERIIDAALELLPNASDVSVDRIAQAARVSVQTIYTHFGSKRGLLIAVIDTAQRDAGLYADLERIWSSPDGETALRRMVDATIRLWDRLWPLVAFSERARRTDAEIGRHMAEIDGYRRSNLRSITDRLELEGRVRGGRDASWAADLAFAMTMPSILDELSHARAWPLGDAASTIVEAVVVAVIEPGSRASIAEPADWSEVLRPSAAGLANG